MRPARATRALLRGTNTPSLGINRQADWTNSGLASSGRMRVFGFLSPMSTLISNGVRFCMEIGSLLLPRSPEGLIHCIRRKEHNNVVLTSIVISQSQYRLKIACRPRSDLESHKLTATIFLQLRLR